MTTTVATATGREAGGDDSNDDRRQRGVRDVPFFFLSFHFISTNDYLRVDSA